MVYSHMTIIQCKLVQTPWMRNERRKEELLIPEGTMNEVLGFNRLISYRSGSPRSMRAKLEHR